MCLDRCIFGLLEGTTEWQEVDVPSQPFHDFGSFNRIKVKLIRPSIWFAGGRKLHITETDLPTANGYWSLDGREYELKYKDETIALLRTEDCGLGACKARTFVAQYGFKIH